MSDVRAEMFFLPRFSSTLRDQKTVKKQINAPSMKCFPIIPPIIDHKMILFTTIKMFHGKTFRKTVLKLGSGSVSSALRWMKNAREEAHARLKMLMGMEIFWVKLASPVDKIMTSCTMACGPDSVKDSYIPTIPALCWIASTSLQCLSSKPDIPNFN